MNRDVPPFYGNREDNMSCSLATYRSLIEHFTGQVTGWDDIAKLQGFKPGVTAWTVKALTQLSKNGWDIVMYEPFNYLKYLDDGIEYLYDQFGKEAADWQIQNSNVIEMKKYIPDFVGSVKHYVKNPTIEDVEGMIDDGRLVTLILNSRILNQQKGYVAHSILIFDNDDHHFKFHDPGLPPRKSRIEKKSLVKKAAGKPSDATGFKLRT